MLFRKRKPPRYPGRPRLPIIRRKLPMRYHMRHQFGTRDLAFLQTMVALTGSPLSDGNRVDILRNGVRIFPSMLAAIRQAAMPGRSAWCATCTSAASAPGTCASCSE